MHLYMQLLFEIEMFFNNVNVFTVILSNCHINVSLCVSTHLKKKESKISYKIIYSFVYFLFKYYYT